MVRGSFVEVYVMGNLFLASYFIAFIRSIHYAANSQYPRSAVVVPLGCPWSTDSPGGAPHTPGGAPKITQGYTRVHPRAYLGGSQGGFLG